MKQHRIALLLSISFVALIAGCTKKADKRVVPPVRVYSYNETQKDVTVKVATELCDKQIYKKNPILKKYQPLEITITNDSDEQIELAAYNIGIHFHSLSHIMKKTPTLGTGRKVFWVADLAGVSASVTYGVLTKFTISSLLAPSLAVIPLAIFPFLLFETIVHIGKINSEKAKIKKHLRRVILDPAQTIILDPHTSIRRSLFCPHKFMKQYFNITLINSQTFEPYIFNVSLKEQA